MILTGGFYTLNTVSVYNAEGWQRDLPPLNTGRRNHACSSYWSGERRVRYQYDGEIKKIWPSSYSKFREIYHSVYILVKCEPGGEFLFGQFSLLVPRSSL